MNRASARFVRRAFTFEHLDHQPLATLLDALVEEDLDLLDAGRVLGRCESELLFDRLEVLAEETTAFLEILAEKRLGMSRC
jgi:hypothetical protein